MQNEEMKYDIEGLANELEVDLESIIGLYSSYFEEMKSEIDSMKGFLMKRDWYMLQRVVHNIKGVSANLGINDVFAEAEKFDILLKNNENDKANIYSENIEKMIASAESEIRKYFDGKGLSL